VIVEKVLSAALSTSNKNPLITSPCNLFLSVLIKIPHREVHQHGNSQCIYEVNCFNLQIFKVLVHNLYKVVKNSLMYLIINSFYS